MGYDIVITNNSLPCRCITEFVANCKCDRSETTFNVSYNHGENLKAVGFYPRNFNGKSMREVLIALGSAINKMLIDGISPLAMIRDVENFQRHPALFPPDKISNAFYEAKMENLLAILMYMRETIERKLAKELDVLYWHSD